MRKLILALTACALLSVSTTAMAGPIPYPTPGSTNGDNYSFTAASTGDIIAYFYGASASYGSKIRLLVNGTWTGIEGLQNNSTPVGTSINLGTVAAGDALTFELHVSTSSSTGPPPLAYILSSNPASNGGVQHIYSTAFSGQVGPVIPAGTYIGFEDIVPITGGDRDYNDHQFVFTNVAVSTPDGGATLALLGGALMALGAARRRLTC